MTRRGIPKNKRKGAKMNNETNMDHERGSMTVIVWPMVIAAIVAAIVALIGLTGCQSINLDDPRLQAAFDKAVSAIEKAIEDGKRIPGDASGNTDTPPAAGADAVAYSQLHWSHGGFNGSKAVRHDGAEIADLKIKADGMSYRWARGGCEQLGAGSRTDAGKTLACLFYLDASGKWQGGKFDWISTSRTTRDFKNIHGGYNGWNPSAFAAATEYAFVIVGTNGRRTNVIRGVK